MTFIEEPQAGELPVLRALLADPVVYVDVGAGEYAECSNTWPFYKAGGHGLLVEPNSEFWHELEVNRPRDILLSVAAHSFTGQMPMYRAGTVTSVHSDWAESKHSFIAAAMPLAAMLARYPDIRDNCQLCSIDVEGAERDVLLGIDWAAFRPKVFIVEYIKYHPTEVGEDLSGQWRKIIESHGYRECCRSWLNIIYIREKDWAEWEAIRGTVQPPHQTVEESRRHYAERYGR